MAMAPGLYALNVFFFSIRLNQIWPNRDRFVSMGHLDVTLQLAALTVLKVNAQYERTGRRLRLTRSKFSPTRQLPRAYDSGTSG